MITPTIPANEAGRLEALRGYGILHTEKEVEYEQITDLATNLTGLPISLVSFVDMEEVWFKATKGMDICSSERGLSFCSHAVGHTDLVFMLEDIKADERFHDHPYANLENNPIQFYAGVCLVDKDGYKLGTLCVIDNKPNSLNENQLGGLRILAKQVVKLVELHKANNVLKEIQVDLEKKNKELKDFAGVVSHDMKMPLANIIVTTDILKAKFADNLDPKALDYLSYLKQSSFTLSDYISGLLAHYESDKMSDESNESFDIHHLLEEIIELLNINLKCDINFPEENIELTCNRSALEQILLNLIGNSLKYNDKDCIVIDIECKRNSEMVMFKISDNGIGIPEDKIDSIFDLFTTIGNVDRKGNKGNGIGLSTVKKLVNNLGGSIKVESTEGVGTSFEFALKD